MKHAVFRAVGNDN